MQSPAVLFSVPDSSGKSTLVCSRWHPPGRVAFHFPLSILLFLAALSFACKKEPPIEPEKSKTISLTAVDASCTEAWLKATTTQLPAAVRLLRDGHPVSVLGLRSPDSLLTDEGLLSRHTYTYQLQRLNADSSVAETSASVQVTTMDTTSHNWVFDPPVLLGDGNSSVLYNVAIINDTLAYAVGAIYKQDSLGNWDPLPYNLVKWDGREWHLKRVSVLYRGSLITPPLNAIFGFSANDIWLSSGVPIHGDGQNWTQYHLFDMGILTQNDGSINKIWGSSSSELWCVGNRGTIVHYTSGTWQRVASGTTLPVMDIYGSSENWDRKYRILSVAENYGTPGESKILSIENNGAHNVPTIGLTSWGVAGVWFIPNRKYIVIGQGVWSSYSPEGRWLLDNRLPSIATTSISGHGLNDILVGGAFWLLAHWNGLSWQTYFPRTSGSFTSVQMKNDMVVAVGGFGNHAIVVLGHR